MTPLNRPLSTSNWTFSSSGQKSKKKALPRQQIWYRFLIWYIFSVVSQVSTYSKILFLPVTLPFTFLICGFNGASHYVPSLNKGALCYVTSSFHMHDIIISRANTYSIHFVNKCVTQTKAINSVGFETISLDRPVTRRLASLYMQCG